MRRTSADPKKARTDAAKNSKPIGQNGQNKTAQGYNQALKCFSCPLCLAPRSLLITLTVSAGKGTAVFQCTECKREGRTGAGSIQYPYKMSFAPKLQKKVDVFFKFRDYVSESGLQGAAASTNNTAPSSYEAGGSSSLLGGSLLGDALSSSGGGVASRGDDQLLENNADDMELADDDNEGDDLDGLFGGGDDTGDGDTEGAS
jgi:transcription elongation factor Elf1